MKKIILQSFLGLTLLVATIFSFTPLEASAFGCEAGGAGATSCSYTTTLNILGSGVELTSSVSCGAGYYACCNPGSASCSKTKSAEIK